MTNLSTVIIFQLIKYYTFRAHMQQHMKRVHCDIEGNLVSASDAGANNTTFYMCEECNSVFLTQDNLAVHILVQHMNQPHDLQVKDAFHIQGGPKKTIPKICLIYIIN